MDKEKAIQVGIIFKMVYKFFLRSVIEKAVKNSKNTIDDQAFKMLDDLIKGEWWVGNTY